MRHFTDDKQTRTRCLHWPADIAPEEGGEADLAAISTPYDIGQEFDMLVRDVRARFKPWSSGVLQEGMAQNCAPCAMTSWTNGRRTHSTSSASTRRARVRRPTQTCAASTRG